MPNRPPFRPAKRRMLRARNRPALRRLRLAHKLNDSGKFAQAGAVFEELGLAASRRNNPRAPLLLLQAGGAHIKAGNGEVGTDLLIKGLRLMHKMGQIRRLPIAGRRVLDGLREMGMEKEFKLLETEIDNLLIGADLPLSGDMPSTSQRRLPPKCPYCGGTVHPGEVEWISNTAAECDFCGSVIEEGS